MYESTDTAGFSGGSFEPEPLYGEKKKIWGILQILFAVFLAVWFLIAFFWTIGVGYWMWYEYLMLTVPVTVLIHLIVLAGWFKIQTDAHSPHLRWYIVSLTAALMWICFVLCVVAWELRPPKVEKCAGEDCPFLFWRPTGFCIDKYHEYGKRCLKLDVDSRSYGYFNCSQPSP